jgi:hypothetical protein
MPRRTLVVATSPDPGDELRERVLDHVGDDTEVVVVAPVSDVSFLQWLTNEEDRAREEASRRAREVAEALPAGVVEARVGDPDPLIAVEDALRSFPADELIVVTRPEQQATWLEQDALRAFDRFGLPVVHLVDDDTDGARRLHRAGAPSSERLTAVSHELAEGEGPKSFVLAHTAVLLTIAVLVAAVLAIVAVAYVLAG